MPRNIFVLWTWTLFVLYASHAKASTKFRHAWQQHCSGREGECSGAHIPQKAYVISLPQDVKKRDYLFPQLKTLGFDIETVDGILSDQLGESFTRCEPALLSGYCQAGLTRAHINAWKRIANSGEPAAWVFEDDVVFHDRAVQLFPKYWEIVPKDFDFVSVGQIYPSNQGVKHAAAVAAPEEMPWGTHAYIISAGTAERMARLGDWMMSRARKNIGDRTPWTLDGADIRIDHFVRNYYRHLVIEVERQRWVVFQSPAHIPWSYGHVLANSPSDCRCWCDHLEDCIGHGTAPIVMSEGLASQHTCGNNVTALVRWHQEVGSGSGRTYAAMCKAQAT